MTFTAGSRHNVPVTHVLIVSLSRSGGKLLRMLLDGHSQLNVFPFEHWNRTSKKSIPTRNMDAFERLSVDQKLATAGGEHAERKLLRLHPQTLVDDVMRSWRARSVDATTLSAMYEGLAAAYFGVLGRSPGATVVNHCGSLCRFTRAELDAVFGRGQHVLTIRDPRAVFSSMDGLLERKVQKGELSGSMLERHREKLEPVDGATGYLREFCEDYRSMFSRYAAAADVIRVRFEDLVTDATGTMERLAGRLAIRWEPGLITPSQFGVPHAANSSFSRQGATVHQQAAYDWVGRIEPRTREYIERELVDEMTALGYQPLASSGAPTLASAPILRDQ